MKQLDGRDETEGLAVVSCKGLTLVEHHLIIITILHDVVLLYYYNYILLYLTIYYYNDVVFSVLLKFIVFQISYSCHSGEGFAPT